jgi:molybdenum cofactor cytidylyltransferase
VPVAALLAAGAGTRFVGPAHKLLANLRGRPLSSYALDNVTAAGFAQIVVVTGAVDLGALLPPGVTVVVNPDWASGQATSLAAAVRWAQSAGADALVIGLGDQPNIAPSAWRALGAHRATPIAVATYGGRRGHPVYLAREVWDRLPTAGDVGARELMSAAPELVVEVACEGDPSDVDTVEDLRREDLGTSS